MDGFEDYRRETSFLYKNRKEFRKRIKSGLIESRKILGNLKNQFIIGYCFGGTAVLETARSGEEMTGFVGFHDWYWDAVTRRLWLFQGMPDLTKNA